MICPTSQPRAERQAFECTHESQDSQAILEAYRAEFGVGTITSCSPPERMYARASGSSNKKTQAPIDPSKPPSDTGIEARLAAGDAQKQSRPRPATEKQLYGQEAADNDADSLTNQIDSTGDETRDCSRPGEFSNAADSNAIPRPGNTPHAVQDDASESLIDILKPPPLPIAGFAPPPLPRKMDISQQTPTQVNDDRDYTEYCDIVPSSPVTGSGNNTQLQSTEPRTLHEDDTGIVNFGILSELGRPSSQVSEDAGFENTRGDWRLPTDDTSQQHSSHAFTPHRPRDTAFETPAPSKNPFGAKPNVTAPLAGSQLFGQTQFSSAVKKISPTSSRPTPRVHHRSILPIIETSPLKNRTNVSSPTDIQTSSPQRLHEIPGTLSREKDADLDRPQTPLGSKSPGDLIPESPDDAPSFVQSKLIGKNGPLSHYIPMKKSQERKSTEGLLPAYVASDSDSDDPIRRMDRRKRAKRKRAKAAEELEKVNFIPRSRRDSAEQPGRKRRRDMSDITTNSAPSHARTQSDQANIEELPTSVRDSQSRMALSNETALGESTKATPGDSLEPTQLVDSERNPMMIDDVDKAHNEEMIPATSPVGSLQPTDQQAPPPEPELPSLIVKEEEGGGPEETSKEAESSSMPLIRKYSRKTYGRARRQRRKNPFISSSDVAMAEPGPLGEHAPSTLPDIAPGTIVEEAGAEAIEDLAQETEVLQEDTGPRKETPSHPAPRRESIPPPMTTRSRRSEAAPTTPVVSRTTDTALPTSSSLSDPSTTPLASAKTTPGTQGSPSPNRAESVTLPTPKKVLHKKAVRASTRSESPQPLARARRMAKRRPQLDSESTDELHHSPPGSALEKSMVQAKSSRSFRQSLGPIHRTGRLFEGMVFAISFQSGQVKQNERTNLERKIAQAGGVILSEGFQELFEHPAIMSATSPVMDDEDPLTLTRASSDSGFTALIADSHSRKAKYMQALALGLPCLAHQWVTACLNKEAIVDWEPYVLCAGASTILGNAIRSRNLAPYPAVGTKLSDVIDQRSLLLSGQRILVVVDSKKARSVAKEPYMFLAKALGPSITRVFTTQQAREALLEHEKSGRPFDWLYVDKGTSAVDAVLSSYDSSGKKRKMKGWAFPKLVSVRVLDDELVIQSLILGRMVEEDEMNA